MRLFQEDIHPFRTCHEQPILAMVFEDTNQYNLKDLE